MGKQYALLHEDGTIYATGTKKSLEKALWLIPNGTIVESEFEYNWDGKIVYKGHTTEKPKIESSDTPIVDNDNINTSEIIAQQQEKISSLETQINELQKTLSDLKSKLTFRI